MQGPLPERVPLCIDCGANGLPDAPPGGTCPFCGGTIHLYERVAGPDDTDAPPRDPDTSAE